MCMYDSAMKSLWKVKVKDVVKQSLFVQTRLASSPLFLP